MINIIKRIQNKEIFREGSSLRYSEKLEELDQERVLLVRELDEIKHDLSKIEKFDNVKNTYISEVVVEVENRLRPIDWFINQHGTDICPFCQSRSDWAIDNLIVLKEKQDEIKISFIQNFSPSCFSYNNGQWGQCPIQTGFPGRCRIV